MNGFSQPQVPQVDAEHVMEAIKDKKDIVILDVRTEQEVTKTRIGGSINIPLDRILELVEKTIPDKEKTIYAYCLSGSRSAVAVEEMVKLGYKNVFSMSSGLLAWRAKQYPLSQ